MWFSKVKVRGILVAKTLAGALRVFICFEVILYFVNSPVIGSLLYFSSAAGDGK